MRRAYVAEPHTSEHSMSHRESAAYMERAERLHVFARKVCHGTSLGLPCSGAPECEGGCFEFMPTMNGLNETW